MDAKQTKQQPKITLNIQPGPLSPAQQRAGKLFWQHLIATAKTNEKPAVEATGRKCQPSIDNPLTSSTTVLQWDKKRK